MLEGCKKIYSNFEEEFEKNYKLRNNGTERLQISENYGPVPFL